MDYSVFIGRFQPFHLGHKLIIDEALKVSDYVIILLGSAGSAPNTRNPFSVKERIEMIRNSYSPDQKSRLFFKGIEDNIYNDQAWVKSVQSAVSDAMYSISEGRGTVSLIGHKKDSTSYYLDLFPHWNKIEVNSTISLSATDIREAYLEDASYSLVQDFVLSNSPKSTIEFLSNYKNSNMYKLLNQEFKFINNYKKQFEDLKYPPTFVTVDSVVVCSGHVLLIERKAMPGKGLLALPGGFLNQNETMLDGAIRELREETRLKVPEPILRGSLKSSKTYDDPFRSARGRTVTQAYYFLLQPVDSKLPKVKGSDDARKAFWIPFCDLTPSNMFEDHYSIIKDLIQI